MAPNQVRWPRCSALNEQTNDCFFCSLISFCFPTSALSTWQRETLALQAPRLSIRCWWKTYREMCAIIHFHRVDTLHLPSAVDMSHLLEMHRGLVWRLLSLYNLSCFLRQEKIDKKNQHKVVQCLKAFMNNKVRCDHLTYGKWMHLMTHSKNSQIIKLNELQIKLLIWDF